MKFWKGNRLDAEFDAEPAEVARQFAEWFRRQSAHYRVNMRLDRALRSWLTRSDGFNSTWDEGPDYEALFNAAYDQVYGAEGDASVGAGHAG